MRMMRIMMRIYKASHHEVTCLSSEWQLWEWYDLNDDDGDDVKFHRVLKCWSGWWEWWWWQLWGWCELWWGYEVSRYNHDRHQYLNRRNLEYIKNQTRQTMNFEFIKFKDSITPHIKQEPRMIWWIIKISANFNQNKLEWNLEKLIYKDVRCAIAEVSILLKFGDTDLSGIWDFQVNWWSAWMWSEITQFDGSWIIFCLWSECVEVSDEWNVLTCNKVCRSCAFNLLNSTLQILVGAILVLKMALVLAIFSISALKFENWQQQNGLQTVSFCDFQ